jgi:hypothetical protein
MSMYRSYDLIIDGNADQVAAALPHVTLDGWIDMPDAYVQDERVYTQHDAPVTWWTFDAREQAHGYIVARCEVAYVASGAMISLEWYASHLDRCGGHRWGTEFHGPQEWSGPYYGQRGG